MLTVDSLNRTEWLETTRKISDPTITRARDDRELAEGSKPTIDYVKKHELTPRRMSSSLQLVDRRITALKRASGIPIDKDESKVYFLSPENYKKAIKLYEESEQTPTAAVYLADADQILVKDNRDRSDYLIAASVLHERIHREIDLKVRVLSEQDVRIHSGLIRSGLQVVRFTSTGENNKYGTLMNELGNYGIEKGTIKDLLTLPDNRIDALIRKLRLWTLRRSKKTKSISMEFSGVGIIFFDLSNIHFDLRGQPLCGFNSFIMMQLVDEIKRICPQVSDIPLEDALIRAKAHPEFQNQIRRSLDSVLGNGFFSKLKSAPCDIDTTLQILYEIQQKTRK